MKRPLLRARSRAEWAMRVATVCSFGLIVGGAGSCGATTSSSSSVTATGTNLRIYASVPPTVNGGADVLGAEKLALQGAGAIGKYTVSLVPLTSSSSVSQNARTAIEDPSAIAYIGELAPGASASSIGITNALDLLQVSPGDTAIELTASTAAAPGAPNNLYEELSTYGRTFARVVPSASLEVRADVQEMEKLGVKHVYAADDGSPYGASTADALVGAARGVLSAAQTGVAGASEFRSSGADALFYAAEPQNAAAAARFIASVIQQDPQVKVFVPSGVGTAALTSSLAGAGSGTKVYASAPGFLPMKDLPTAGQTFEQTFRSTYGHAPKTTQAIFAYEAVRSVLAVLREAGTNVDQRATVVHDYFAIRNRSSVLGTYSINSDGDTSLGPFVFSRWRAGSFVPFAFVECQTGSSSCTTSGS